MKTYLKHGIIWIVMSVLMMIFWIVGLMIGGAIYPGSLEAASSDFEYGELMLFIICLLNTATLLYFIYNSHLNGLKLISVTFLISFGLQYFLSQIETIWFNDALKMSQELIWTVVIGGGISNLLFAITSTLITGNFKKGRKIQLHLNSHRNSLIKTVALLSIVVWPIIYLMAGYLIAWQFSDVRAYYTGTQKMASFYEIMKGNITSGLYIFQIFRGLIWIGIGYLVLVSIECSEIHKSIILGLLFSVISSSQLLLPNPIMPDMVRIPHLIETGTSNFLWGFILAWTLNKFVKNNIIQSQYA